MSYHLAPAAVIADVYLYANGQVMTFDAGGGQMPAYQGRHAEVRARVLADAPDAARFHLAGWRPSRTLTFAVPRAQWARFRYDHGDA